jgi:RNA polymerase sigma-70 factor (ECF subfamily)
MMKRYAYQLFLRQTQDRVFSYAMYMLRNREDAEDVTQEVFVKMWKHWEKVEKEKRESWILRVAHNYCIDLLRRKSAPRRSWTTLEDSDDRRLSIAYSVSPEQEMELSETQKAILASLSNIPEKMRSMMLLHYYQGVKFEEIAEILDMSLPAVKTGLHRARKQLKGALERQYPELAGAIHVQTA